MLSSTPFKVLFKEECFDTLKHLYFDESSGAITDHASLLSANAPMSAHVRAVTAAAADALMLAAVPQLTLMALACGPHWWHQVQS